MNNSPDVSELWGVRQWYMNPRGGEWQLNSEFTLSSEYSERIITHDSLVYLVLDKSSSITPDNIDRIRNSAKDFIRALYDIFN